MRGRILEAFLMAAVIGAPVSAEAGWREHANSYDRNRIERLSESRMQGMADSGGIDAVQSAMSAPVVSGGSPAGEWRCRTLKLGGMTPSMIYTWHHCRITDRGGVLAFEKLDGTQRMAGTLYPDGEGYVYLGASWVKGEHPHRYSGAGASVGAKTTPDDQAGKLFMTASGARIELPFPAQESTFDVIELRR